MNGFRGVQAVDGGRSGGVNGFRSVQAADGGRTGLQATEVTHTCVPFDARFKDSTPTVLEEAMLLVCEIHVQNILRMYTVKLRI